MTTGNAKPSPAVRYVLVFRPVFGRPMYVEHHSRAEAEADLRHRWMFLTPVYLLVVKPKASVAVPA
jgi:hypothetical protein